MRRVPPPAGDITTSSASDRGRLANPRAAASLTARDLCAAAAVVVIWGLNFVAMKLGLRDFTPLQLGAGRFFFAFAPLALWVRPPRIGWKWVVTHSMLQGVAQFTLLFFALKIGMTAALAPVLMQTAVFFTAIFASLLLHESVGRPLKVGMTLAAAGLACFAVNVVTEGAASGVTPAGLALNLLAAAMWAASNVVARKLQAVRSEYDPLALVVWSGFVSSLSFALMSFVLDGGSARWRWTGATLAGWSSLAYLGLVATALANGLWTALLKRHPANRVAPFSLGMPVVGFVAGMLILDEHVTTLQCVGAVLVMSALACVFGGAALRGSSRRGEGTARRTLNDR